MMPFYDDEYDEDWKQTPSNVTSNSWDNILMALTVAVLLPMTVFGLVSGSMFLSDFNHIKHLPCPFSASPLVLHIFAVNLSNVLFLSAYNNSVEYGYITASFGDGLLSGPEDVLINDGFVPILNESSGIYGWRVPELGVYEVTTFMEFECINVDTTGSRPAPFVNCGLDDNVTSAPLHGAAFINQTSGGPLGGALSNFKVDVSNFMEVGTIWETPELGSVIPAIKLILTSVYMTTIIEVTDIDQQHISAGALVIGNNNFAIILPNRDFTIKKLR